MDLDIKQHLPEDFSDNSRVWIYQSSRLFFINEALEMEDMLKNFTNQWKTHGTPVKGFANLFFGRFIVLMADESVSEISGCSTDNSVHLIKDIEKKYNVNLFNRQMLSFIVKDKIEQLPLSQVQYAIEHLFINENTLFFDNTIGTKKQLISNWISPISETWLNRMFIK
jgi:hypothetical protein